MTRETLCALLNEAEPLKYLPYYVNDVLKYLNVMMREYADFPDASIFIELDIAKSALKSIRDVTKNSDDELTYLAVCLRLLMALETALSATNRLKAESVFTLIDANFAEHIIRAITYYNVGGQIDIDASWKPVLTLLNRLDWTTLMQVLNQIRAENYEEIAAVTFVIKKKHLLN